MFTTVRCGIKYSLSCTLNSAGFINDFERNITAANTFDARKYTANTADVFFECIILVVNAFLISAAIGSIRYIIVTRLDTVYAVANSASYRPPEVCA